MDLPYFAHDHRVPHCRHKLPWPVTQFPPGTMLGDPEDAHGDLLGFICVRPGQKPLPVPVECTEAFPTQLYRWLSTRSTDWPHTTTKQVLVFIEHWGWHWWADWVKQNPYGVFTNSYEDEQVDPGVSDLTDPDDLHTPHWRPQS